MNSLRFILIQKKEILGTDVKAFMNDENFKINEKISQGFLLIL